MLLKKLELCGFKSFADKTSFDFKPGVTAFLGPNGCGKSNIVDAFRWILGEQSAKAVRGKQMSDVIFNGSAKRRSVGYAEASLTLENTDGLLASEYTEICITRRLYRSGESEYFINRNPSRLRDIRQLFMDTGVGAHTYSIIEQGKVDRFIQSNAVERRILFEEAAGISRYKAQRKEAQTRIERARLNLQKVDIKLEEQRKQLRSIKYQAAKARRFRRCIERLRKLVVSLSAKNYKEWGAQREEIEAVIAGLQQQHLSLVDELAGLEAQVQAIDGDLERIGGVTRDQRELLHRVDGRIETAEATVRHNEARMVEYREESERTTQMIWSLGEKLRRTEEELAEAARELEAIREAVMRQADTIALESEKADAAAGECARLASAIEEWKGHAIRVIERAASLRNELNHMERGRREQLARRARLAGQLEEKTQEAKRIDEEISRLAGRRDVLSSRQADRSSTLHTKQNELVAVRKQSDQLEVCARELHRTETECYSRREILQDIELRAEDVESGVKHLLRNEEGSAPGVDIFGMVADVIRAELPHAAAVEAALGAGAQFIVVRHEADAGAAARLLRVDKAGRAGLIALNRARAPQLDSVHLADEPGVVGRASDLVHYDAALEPVVRHLLGDTWIVEDLATALRLSGNGGADMRFVTLDGDRVDPSGAILGGEPLPSVGIVSRKSELEAIEGDLIGITEELRRLEAQRGRVSQQVETLDSEVSTLRKEIEQGNLEKLSNENEILNLRKRQNLLADESALLQSELSEIDETVRGYNEREKAIEGELDETTREHDKLQAEVETAQRNLSEQQAVAARMREEVTQLKVKLAEAQTHRGGLEQRIVTAENLRADIAGQIAAARARVEELQRKQADAQGDIEGARRDISEAVQERDRLQADLTRLGKEREAAQARRTECVEKTRGVRGKQEQVREKLQERQMAVQELRVRMESLSERVFSEHGIQLEEFVFDPATMADAVEQEGETVAVEGAPVEPVEIDWQAVEAEIAELREKIRRIGGVNEEAINEEEGLEIAIAETEAQREDLTTAEAHLREVIRKLNRISREKFRKTFEEIRVNFQDTFRRLFGGGRADLVLQEDEPDVLEAGIDVLACPPGKELRSIMLLSGGEKTMTTIALLFAIFRTKPSPFCILDEVDAALDEANIDRFTIMLEEFIKSSQFIIITHSKRTISIADVLYGITMQEKGVSKRVAVSLEGTQAMNN